MANLKVFADKQTDRRMDRQRDGPKTVRPPDLSMRGHKKSVKWQS